MEENKNVDNSLEKQAMEYFTKLQFANLKKSAVQDLINNRNESVIYKKYPVEEVIKMLEFPQKNEKRLRQMSNFLYIVSSHYKRLIDYYATLPTYNYIIVPDNSVTKKINIKTYKDTYNKVIHQFEKYNFKDELPRIITETLLNGVFCGLTYQTEDSFYIKSFNPDYTQISSIEDGCYMFSIDLNYFTSKEYLLPMYGKEIENAFYQYKGNKEKGIKGNTKLKWFEPKNGICIKSDPNNPLFSVPVFCSTFLEVLDLEDYRMLKKAKKTLSNYKALAMQVETDENGIPKMDFELVTKYYNQAAANVPDGIGLIVSPFKINDFSFSDSSNADTDALNEAVENFWSTSGTSGMLFGSSKASSSSSLSLSTKPDEEISFRYLKQIERFFNKQIKLLNLPYLFKLSFLEQSIFNADEISNRLFKGATYGVSGSKLLYGASIGMSPSNMSNLAYLENDVLNITDEMFNSPLISSNTLSPDSSTSSEAGATTIEERGSNPSDNTEKSRESNGNNEN